jgi:hypothetical protein
MVLSLIAGILSILVTWAVLMAIACGIGLIFRRLFGLRMLDAQSLLASFWFGTSLIVLFLQLWHFLFPIKWHAFAVLLAVGIGGLLGSATELRGWLDRTNWRKSFVLFSVLALAGLWVANRAMGPCTAYDSGMYHFPTMNWAKSFPIVPGLGNLHGRLAFNGSSLLYAAMVDVGPWSARSNHIVNGLFLFALLIQIVLHIFQLPRGSETKRALCLFNIALLTPTIMLIQDPDFISSFTPDLPAAVVLFVAASTLFAQLVNTDKHNDAHEGAYNLVVVTALLAVAVCFKLSAIVFSIMAWFLTVIWCLQHYREGKRLTIKLLGWIVVISMALGISWLGRGVILSGYPAYPSRLGAVPVQWRVPPEQAEAEQAWIGHFARNYHHDSLYHLPYGDQGVLKGKWLRPWIKSLIQDPAAQWQVTLPALLTILLLFIYFLVRGRCNSDDASASAGWLLLTPILGSVMFWFFIAPRPLFGFFSFWILVALCAGQVGKAGICSARHRFVAELLAIGFLIGALTLGLNLFSIGKNIFSNGINPVVAVSQELVIRPDSEIWFRPTIVPRLEAFTTESGLVLYVPENDNRCFNAPLPCTPHPAPNLRLRRAKTLQSGFVTDGQWHPLRWPNPWTTFLPSWREYHRANDPR